MEASLRLANVSALDLEEEFRSLDEMANDIDVESSLHGVFAKGEHGLSPARSIGELPRMIDAKECLCGRPTHTLCQHGILAMNRRPLEDGYRVYSDIVRSLIRRL